MPMPFDLIVGWWGVLLLHRQENRRKRSELRRCSYRELGAWWLCLAHNPYCQFARCPRDDGEDAGWSLTAPL